MKAGGLEGVMSVDWNGEMVEVVGSDGIITSCMQIGLKNMT